MSYAEFPHTEMWDNDKGHQELIHFYLEVREKYTATLNEITKVSNELDEYRRNMNAEINTAVELSVKRVVAQSLQEIQNAITKLETDIAMQKTIFELFKNSTTQQLTELESSINELNKDLTSKINTVNSNLSKAIAEVNIAVVNAEERLNTSILNTDKKLSKMISDGDSETLVSAENYANEITEVINEKLNKRIDFIEATASSNAITWLWQYGCCHGGFTAYEWYHLTQITCEDWNNSNITAWEWYVMGKDIFRRFRNCMKMYSPVSGHFVDVRVALLELAEKLNIGSITAGDYEQLNISAEDYDKLNITGGQYDWKGKEILNVQ